MHNDKFVKEKPTMTICKTSCPKQQFAKKSCQKRQFPNFAKKGPQQQFSKKYYQEDECAICVAYLVKF